MTVSKNLEQTREIAKDFLKKIKPGQRATIICLKGELGAGKTAFVKFAGEILGLKKKITSPTFVILKSYKLPVRQNLGAGGKVKGYELMYHIDAYRLKSGKELEKLGWKETVEDPKNLIFIEWPENVSKVIPKKAVIIKFKAIGTSRRLIEIIWPPKKKNLRKKMTKRKG